MCNELFFKVDGFGAFIFMKVKVTPHTVMNSFWMQFRLSKVTISGFTKELYLSDKRYLGEVEEQKVKEAEDKIRWHQQHWAFNEYLRNYFHEIDKVSLE